MLHFETFISAEVLEKKVRARKLADKNVKETFEAFYKGIGKKRRLNIKGESNFAFPEYEKFTQIGKRRE